MAFSHKHNYLYYTMGVIMGVLLSMKGCSSFSTFFDKLLFHYFSVVPCMQIASVWKLSAMLMAGGIWLVAGGKW